jgi:hypothetical protein
MTFRQQRGLCVTPGERVVVFNGLRRIWNEAVVACFKVSHNLPGSTKKNNVFNVLFVVSPIRNKLLFILNLQLNALMNKLTPHTHRLIASNVNVSRTLNVAVSFL